MFQPYPENLKLNRIGRGWKIAIEKCYLQCFYFDFDHTLEWEFDTQTTFKRNQMIIIISYWHAHLNWNYWEQWKKLNYEMEYLEVYAFTFNAIVERIQAGWVSCFCFLLKPVY